MQSYVLEKEFTTSQDKSVKDKYQQLLKDAGGEQQDNSEAEKKQPGWNNAKKKELTDYMSKLEENGHTFKPATFSEKDGNSYVLIGIASYWGSFENKPQIDQAGTFILNGQPFAYNLNNDQGQYKLVAAYESDMEVKGFYDAPKVKGYVFILKDNKPYVFEVKYGGEDNLIPVTSGEVFDKFNELLK